MKNMHFQALSIPNQLQNAKFGLSLFAPVLPKKIRNRTSYYSSFSTAQTQKSSRPKHSILKLIGYKMLLVFLGLLCSVMAFATSVKSLSTKLDANKVEVKINLTSPFSYEVFVLKEPTRVVVDLFGIAKNLDVPLQYPNSSSIKNIRTSFNNNGKLRLVYDMKKQVSVNTRKEQNSLIITMLEHSSAPPTFMDSIKTEKRAQIKPPKILRDVVIVLDPGHGGKDPGALGSNKHREKDIVLQIAKKLKKMIDSEPGMRAILTREGDYYIGLRERLNIARKHDADIFISIHADAYHNKRSSGASVFALSQTGATSEAARWIAEKENYSELGGVDLSELDDDNGVIRSVLIDLSQTATIESSLKMGDFVLKDIDKVTELHHSKVEQARFVVLKSPDIPSILIETGFITNPREERNLASKYYQSKLTKAVFVGLKKYFWESPPHGTKIAALANSKLYFVKKGDSLSKIAENYNITVNQLKSYNQLKTSVIKVGQKLMIPSQTV